MGLMTGYYPDEPDTEEAEWERLNLPPLPPSQLGMYTDLQLVAYAIEARKTEPLYELPGDDDDF